MTTMWVQHYKKPVYLSPPSIIHIIFAAKSITKWQSFPLWALYTFLFVCMDLNTAPCSISLKNTKTFVELCETKDMDLWHELEGCCFCSTGGLACKCALMLGEKVVTSTDITEQHGRQVKLGVSLPKTVELGCWRSQHLFHYCIADVWVPQYCDCIKNCRNQCFVNCFHLQATVALGRKFYSVAVRTVL